MKGKLTSQPRLVGAKPENGRIGIFWWYGFRLYSFATPVGLTKVVRGVVDSDYVHVETWAKLQRIHPQLRDFEYDNVPRGRVVYLRRRNIFRVFMDKVLFRAQIKAAILKAFYLSRERSEFKSDLHYTTGCEEIERLFRGE